MDNVAFELVMTDSGEFKRVLLAPSASELKTNEVLIRPTYVGICGSDLFLIHSKLKNLRLGHEWVGEIIAVGKDVGHLRTGDLVTGTGHFSCGNCESCFTGRSNLCSNILHFSSDKMGALRSYFAAPGEQVFKLDSPIDPSLALLEVLAVGEQAYSLIHNTLESKSSKKLLIFGAGPIGLAVAFVLRSYGHDSRIIEKNEFRIKNARSAGFNVTSLSEAVLTLKDQFNVLIDCTNDYSGDAGAFKWINYFSEKEYTALIVGKYINSQINLNAFNSKSSTLLWMRGVGHSIMKMTVPKWERKSVSLAPYFITHTYHVSEIEKAFTAAENKSESIKVLVSL